ncbi:MAG: hypothetical protein ACI9K2_005049 [Myxococcota bacterium]|jgi:hypothetical protein
MRVAAVVLGLAAGCGSAACPEGTVPDDGGVCIRPAEGCPDGYSPTPDGACLWTGSSTTGSSTPTDTTLPTTTRPTGTTTPTDTADTGSTGGTTTTPVEGPGAVHWVGMRRFTFMVAPSAAAGPGRWEDDSVHPLRYTIAFADDAHLESGLEPAIGFHCEVSFTSTTSVPPIIGDWVGSGDATVGYELPPDAVVDVDSCAGRIHAEYADYLDRLDATTIGVGLHDISPAEQAALAAALPAWPAVREWAIGAGWHLDSVIGTTPSASYSANGYAVGHEVDETGRVALDGADQPIPQDRDASMRAGGFPSEAWYEGEVFLFWPVQVLFD